jgi:hypothetical protein
MDSIAMKLIKGKSYIWLFYIYFVLFVTSGMILPAIGMTAGIKYASILIPMTFGSLLVLEIRSGIALDSWWRAEYEKGKWQYPALLAWHATGLVGSVVLCYFMLTRFP